MSRKPTSFPTSGPSRKGSFAIRSNSGQFASVEIKRHKGARRGSTIARRGSTGSAQDSMTEVERRQLELYAQKVQQRAADRFENEAELVNWFNNGRVPGFGTKSPLQLVKEGFGAQVIEAINAVEAGVYA